MGVMDIFNNLMGSGSTQSQPAQPGSTPATEGNIPVNTPATGQASSGTAPNGTVPPGTDISTPVKVESPLDLFTDFWQNDPNAATPETPIFSNIDPQKLMEAASKTDFSKIITQEQLTKIQAGGPEAMMAVVDAMNKMSQNVYAQAAFASTKIVAQALEQAESRFNTSLPGKLKLHTASEAIRNENPALSHPAAQPILSAIESQMAVKFPNASSAELTSLAKNYLENFADAAARKPEVATPAKSRNETDWNSFL